MAPKYDPKLTCNSKTGLTVPDSGIRDEDGLEPMDHLFSSPEKPITAPTLKPAPKPAAPVAPVAASTVSSLSVRKPLQLTKRPQAKMNTTIDTEVSMDIQNSTIPEPTEVLKERRKSLHQLPPRARSPAKTFLQSPARRHPSLGPVSSPTRGSIMEPNRPPEREPVARKLDFSNENRMSPPKRRPSSKATAKTPKTVNGKSRAKEIFQEAVVATPPSAAFKTPKSVTFMEDSSIAQVRAFSPASPRDDDLDYHPAGFDDDEEALTEELERTATPPLPSPPKAVTSKRGRAEMEKENTKPSKKPAPLPELLHDDEPAPYDQHDDAASDATVPFDEPILPPTKKAKTVVPAVKAEPVKRGRGRPPKSEKIDRKPKMSASPTRDSSPVHIYQGPPRPKQKGLFILRREVNGVAGATNRNARASIKPMKLWKTEPIKYDEEEEESLYKPEAITNGKTKSKGKKSEIEEYMDRGSDDFEPPKKKNKQPDPFLDDIEDEESTLEPWERSPGRISGSVKTWDPIKNTASSTLPESEAEIAYSSLAILTHPITTSVAPGDPPPARFAKTITLPFFGAGVVDLPAGAVKKLKNARKMQMCFFVFKGRVEVEVNGTHFGVGEGGSWQVPRGNAYSIRNKGKREARVWFAQGCEVEAGSIGQ